jgi:uncharacterized membrane protein YjjB (DUF3815 family)
MFKEILISMTYCFIASWFFACIMHAPRKALLPSAFAASMGYMVFFVFIELNEPRLGYFFGTLLVATFGEFFAKRLKMLSTIFIFPGVIPIVPGFDLYQTLSALVLGDFNNALVTGANAILNIGAMSIAIAIVGFIRKRGDGQTV